MNVNRARASRRRQHPARPCSKADAMHVVVIGAGLLGLSCAIHLQRGGARVTVIDRAPGPGLGTSFGNGALLHASLVRPWNGPGVGRELLRSWGRSDAALVVRPRAWPTLPGWGLRFLAASKPEWHDHAARANLHLALHTRRVMQRLRDDHALAYGQHFDGVTVIYTQAEALAAGQRQAEAAAADGVASQRLDTAALHVHEPALADAQATFVGALHYPDDEGGDAHLFCVELARVCVAGGVVLRTGVAVALEPGSKTGAPIVHAGDAPLACDAVVLAAGPQSEALARPLGLRLPIRPVKGYSLTFTAPPGLPVPRVPIIDDEGHAAVVPVGDNRLRAVGTAEFAGHDLSIDPKRLALLKQLVHRLYPRLAPGVDGPAAQAWAGLRPMCADGLPLLGPTPVSGLWLCTGHGHLGWTLAAGSGDLVAAAVLGRAPALPLDDYRLDRFGRVR
jgi:D-amino-acid dehydrogenase